MGTTPVPPSHTGARCHQMQERCTGTPANVPPPADHIIKQRALTIMNYFREPATGMTVNTYVASNTTFFTELLGVLFPQVSVDASFRSRILDIVPEALMNRADHFRLRDDPAPGPAQAPEQAAHVTPPTDVVQLPPQTFPTKEQPLPTAKRSYAAAAAAPPGAWVTVTSKRRARLDPKQRTLTALWSQPAPNTTGAFPLQNPTESPAQAVPPPQGPSELPKEPAQSKTPEVGTNKAPTRKSRGKKATTIKPKPQKTQKPGAAPQPTLEETWGRPPAQTPPETGPQAPEAAHAPGQAAAANNTTIPDLGLIHIVTLNVMGLMSHLDLAAGALAHPPETPDIVILTETKLNPHAHHSSAGKQVRNLLPDHAMFMGSCPLRGQRTHGGIVLCISKKYATPYRALRTDAPSGLDGHVIHCTLAPPGCTNSHIYAVYMPEDRALRLKIYSYLETETQQNHVNGEYMVVGGDWNATLFQNDRSNRSEDAADTMHRMRCAAIHMAPVAGHSEERPHTFFRMGDSGPVTSSRIDDVLCPSRQARTGLPHATERTHEVGGSLDHRMLITSCPPSLLGIPHLSVSATAAPRPDMPPALKLPIAKGQLRATTDRIEAELSPQRSTISSTIIKAKNKLVAALKGDFGSEHYQM